VELVFWCADLGRFLWADIGKSLFEALAAEGKKVTANHPQARSINQILI
jgi:hypothetical protein